MSTLSDVQALYGSVQSSWEKSQAHVVAHVVLLLIVFVLAGSTLPELSFPRPDAKQISENDWFKLAKDTGVIYVSLVIPIILVAAYLAALRVIGQFLVAAIMTLFPPFPQYRILNAEILKPLALALKKETFTFNDLLNKAAQLSLKYKSTKNENWDAYQQSLNGLTRNSQLYLGDFLLFSLIWVGLFRLMPQAAWVQANQVRFWPVLLTLLGLTLFAWFRVFRAMKAVPSLLLINVSTMLRVDPDMSPMLEVPEEKQEEIRQKLEELLRNEQQRAERRPSLRRFLRHRIGLSVKGDRGRNSWRGLPFPSLYQRGSRFSRDEDRYERYDKRWFGEYTAYLYYRLHERLSRLARALWHLARYIITGAPY